MLYTIWRVSPVSDPIEISTSGSTSVKERALQKANMYNEKLKASEPESADRFIVMDEKGRELKAS